MTNELRFIIEELAAGKCVPSLQKRAAEMLTIAEEQACILDHLANIYLLGGAPSAETMARVNACLDRAAGLFFYTDEQPEHGGSR
jgi:hypothetical protein